MNKKKILIPILFLICLWIINPALLFSKDSTDDLEDTLASVKLGSKVEDLLAKFPKIYKNRLFMGEVLYEACNQKELEVFTFTEEPWSQGYITNIWIRKAEESVCRDSTGSLPDYNISPVTPRGVKLGDKEEKVIKAYGQPTDIKTMKNGNKMISYRTSGKLQRVDAINLSLNFVIEDSRVKSFHLFGDMSWAKKPF